MNIEWDEEPLAPLEIEFPNAEHLKRYRSLFITPQSNCNTRFVPCGRLTLEINPIKSRRNDDTFAYIRIYNPNQRTIYIDVSEEVLTAFMQCKISLRTLIETSVCFQVYIDSGPSHAIKNREEVIAYLEGVMKNGSTI